MSESSNSSLYPFDSASSLLVNNHLFPYNLIDDIFIMIRDESVPLYVSRINAGPVMNPLSNSILYSDSLAFEQKGLGKLSVFIADSTGILIASFLLTRETSITAAEITTLRGTLCGGIKLDPSLYAWLYSMTKNTLYGLLLLSPDSLILHPNTLACVSYSGYLGMSLNGLYLGNHVHLAVQHNLKFSSNSSNSNYIQINAFGDYDTSFEQTEKLEEVNGVDLRGKSLIIKPSTLGDLRVITEDNKIELIGVTDI